MKITIETQRFVHVNDIKDLLQFAFANLRASGQDRFECENKDLGLKIVVDANTVEETQNAIDTF